MRTILSLTYQKLSEKYSLTYPEYWNSTEKDMIFIYMGYDYCIDDCSKCNLKWLGEKKEVSCTSFL